MTRRGFTLMEILLASSIASLILGALLTALVSQVKMHEELYRRGSFSTDQSIPALASLHIARHIERADRINIINPSTIQVRTFEPTTAPCTTLVPPASCLDDATNYRWDQYSREGNTLKFYSDILNIATGNKQCAGAVIAPNITALSFAYNDTATTALGTQPFPSGAANNVVSYFLQWDGVFVGIGKALIPQSRQYRGEVMTRAIAYSDVNAQASGAGDSGTGIAPATVSNPPANGACP